jgi:glycosyltransferase involved in cell wall biosynthesis
MISILIPVYNERERVEAAIHAVMAAVLPDEKELVIVDDGSTDGTREILQRLERTEQIRLIEHPENRGKGAAVRTALGAALGDICCVFDADLEYDPEDLPLLARPILEGLTDASFGVRAFDGYTSHSFLFVIGNRIVTLACNLLFNVYLRDIMTCHKMMRTELMRQLDLTASGFAIEAEITARLLQCGTRIYEVPIRYRARATQDGKKLTARDGARVLARNVQ